MLKLIQFGMASNEPIHAEFLRNAETPGLARSENTNRKSRPVILATGIKTSGQARRCASKDGLTWHMLATDKGVSKIARLRTGRGDSRCALSNRGSNELKRAIPGIVVEISTRAWPRDGDILSRRTLFKIDTIFPSRGIPRASKGFPACG